MLTQYKYIMDDLFDYLIDGKHLDDTAPGFNGVSFDSTAIKNIKYQFIRKYDQVNSITDSNIIPVLVVAQPDQYLLGKIFYRGKFNDLRTILITEKDIDDRAIKKINFFIIPQLMGLTGHNMGSINFDLKIDWVSEYDTYGFMSKEIDGILKKHYFRPNCGEFHIIDTHTYGNLYFVPTQSRYINQQSVLNRIAQTFNIRFCSIV